MPYAITRHLPTALAAACLACAAPAHASDKDWDTAGSVTRDALVLTAIGVPIVKGDDAGAFQAGGSMAAAGGVTYLLKSTIHEMRPDGSDDQSFPSGHTSVSFAAAASLQNRYGWKIGLPAHIAAAFVGLSRVEANKHHWHDVLVGAALGEASGLLITSKQNPNVQVFPWAGGGGGGVVLAARF
jgi:membrane-associated phospholipid phosphatase